MTNASFPIPQEKHIHNHDRTLHIGVLGLGVVGSGTVRILQENADEIARRVGARLVVKKIAVRDLHKERAVKVDRALLTNDPYEVVNDPDIDIVAELIGGVSPAQDYVLRAIETGKHIVTANKEMVAKVGHGLMEAAGARSRDFYLEGSVAGGIPIIAAIKESLTGNRVQEVLGIVNGTTNYILTKMSEEGADFAEVLAEAQAHGYAEVDPTSDVDGFDAQYKIAILASIAFNSRVYVEQVAAQGIRGIEARDIALARELGYRIKLVAFAQQSPDGRAMQVRVHPTLLPQSHPLASVNGVMNAVLVKGDAVGQVMFYGPGAGSLPTGSAVVGDLVAVGRNILAGSTGRVGCTCFEQKQMLTMDTVETRFYVRVLTDDKPKVLASVAGVFGEHDVSIETVVQRAQSTEDDPNAGAEIVWVTHRVREADLQAALAKIRELPSVRAVSNCIRVEG